MQVQGAESLTGAVRSAAGGGLVGGCGGGDPVSQGLAFGLMFLASAFPERPPIGLAKGVSSVDDEVPMADETANLDVGLAPTLPDVRGASLPHGIGFLAALAPEVLGALPEPDASPANLPARPHPVDARDMAGAAFVQSAVGLHSRAGVLAVAADPMTPAPPPRQPETLDPLQEMALDSAPVKPASPQRTDDNLCLRSGTPNDPAASKVRSEPVLSGPDVLQQKEPDPHLSAIDPTTARQRERTVPVALHPSSPSQTDEARLPVAALSASAAGPASPITASSLPGIVALQPDRGPTDRSEPSADAGASGAKVVATSVRIHPASAGYDLALRRESRPELASLPPDIAETFAGDRLGESAAAAGVPSPRLRWPGPTETALRILGEAMPFPMIAIPDLPVPQDEPFPDISASSVGSRQADPLPRPLSDVGPAMDRWSPAPGLGPMDATASPKDAPLGAMEAAGGVRRPPEEGRPAFEHVLSAADWARPLPQTAADPAPQPVGPVDMGDVPQASAAAGARPSPLTAANSDLFVASPDCPVVPVLIDRGAVEVALPALTRSAPSHHVQQTALALSLNPPEQAGRIELTLTPENLGKLHFDLRPEGDSLSIILSAERPETLDLMRRHLPYLVAELRQLGLEPGNLSFGTWAEGGQGKPQVHETGQPDSLAAETRPVGPVTDRSAPLTAFGNSGLDLRL